MRGRPAGDPRRALLVRRLNDQLRRFHLGGYVAVSRGVLALGPEFAAATLAAVAAFDRFDAGDDPWGEHDFGALSLRGERLVWTIEYYDPSLTAASPDPADPSVTARVLKVMLASEW